MKRTLMAAAIGLALSTAAFADSCEGPRGGYGPGAMMGGSGPGAMMGGNYGPRGGWEGGAGYGMMGGAGYGRGGGWGGMGMMGEGPGFFGLERLELTAEQREKIGSILKESRAKQWKAMELMHEQAWKEAGVPDGKFDDAAARKAFDARQQLQKQMFENRLETRKQVEAILTAEQRAKLGARFGPG